MPKAFKVPSNIRDNMLFMMNPQILCNMSKLISSFLKGNHGQSKTRYSFSRISF